jgi:putative oxidoreductase
MEPVDLALLILRVAVGIVMLAHGWNHIFGGGKIAGTARWFESLGMRPGWLHAWTASLTELGAGVLLLLGLLTPLAGAALVGVLTVAWITNHRKNGFFIFHPGEGYEYVMTLVASGLLLAGTGGGRISVDHALGMLDPPGWTAALLCAGGGLAGALGLLLTFWRPTTTR